MRTNALREIRAWPRRDIDDAISALGSQAGNLRAVPTVATDIDFRLAEAAVLLHAESGLLYLQAAAWNDGAWHLERSAKLLEWSQRAARDLRALAAEYGQVAGRPQPSRTRALEVRERIVPRDFYVAIAASALVFGQGLPARDFAERGVDAAPLDAEAHLVLGGAAEYLAGEEVLREDDSAASRLHEKAESAFRKAVALDPSLVEARMRLGRRLLGDGRLAEAESILAEAEALSRDERLRYLTRLLLGRVAERRGRPRRRELVPACPRSVAVGADRPHRSAHTLERQGGPSAARAQVAASLDASRQDGRPADPFWLYPFGPPGLAQATLDRVFAVLKP